MKKILWLGILLSILVTSHTFAAYTFNVPTPTSSTINATLSGATGSKSSFQLQVQTTPFSTTTPAVVLTPANIAGGIDPSIQKPNAQGVATWSLSENSNTTYYVQVLEIPPSTIAKPVSPVWATTAQTVKTAQLTLLFHHLKTTPSGSSIIVEGWVDPVKQPGYQKYIVTLSYSTTPPSITAPKVLTSLIANNLQSHQTADSNGPVGISSGTNVGYGGLNPNQNLAGSYYWVLPAPSTGTTYYLQQTITADPANIVVDEVETFNADSGTTLPFTPSPGTAGTSQNLNPHIYTLLAPLPGFSSLPDPLECAAERAAGKAPAICDVNDLLNYFMKLLIGLSGVSLVFRIMYEGFVIMTSDLPFKVASSKSALFTAVWGLLLALSAYLILNTINPQLVAENVGITQLSIVSTAPDTDQTPITQDIGAPTSGTAGACTAGLTSVAVQSSKFTACSTYNNIPVATNLKNMLTAAYAAKVTIQGGGYRTSAQQTKLRISNCGGDTSTPSAACHPPTAPVGHSNHESGLAFDFTCSGVGSYGFANTVCFTWLQKNAGAYGLKNLPSEPWHWSWNGQ